MLEKREKAEKNRKENRKFKTKGCY